MLLVEPPSGELARLTDEMPEWHVAEADAQALSEGTSVGGVRPPAAIIVFARKDEERHALALCQRIRGDQSYKSIPLLVGITIYQMPLGNDVRRLPNAYFIFTPISKNDLRRRVEAMAAADRQE